MFFKKTALLLTSLCFSFFLSTQVNAGGVFYSNEGDTVRIPNDTQMIIILKKGTEITAMDARGNAISPCETCENDLDNTKMLVMLNKDGNLDVIGGTPPKNSGNKTAATQQDDFIQTVTEGIKLRKITKQLRTLSATDPVDEKYAEVWQDMGGELRCFVLNQQTGELMGSCPKEQYP